MPIVADGADDDNFLRDGVNSPDRQQQPKSLIRQAVQQYQQPADDANVTDFLDRAGQLGRSGDAWGTIVPLEPVRPGADIDSAALELLPRWFGEYVAAVAEETQTPVALPLTIGLAAASAMVAGRLDALYHRSHREPANLYAMAVVPPGGRKTSVVRAMTDAIAGLQRDERARVAPDRERAEHLAEVAKMRLDKAKKAYADGKIEQAAYEEAVDSHMAAVAAVPNLPQRLWQDVTPEALARDLGTYGRAAIIEDEPGILQAATRYAANGQANLDVFLSAYNGSRLSITRIGRPSVEVDDAYLTLGVAAQPGMLEAFMGDRRNGDRGFLQRFLITRLHIAAGYQNTRPTPVPVAARAAYDRGIRWLDYVTGTVGIEDGTAAGRLMAEWENQIEADRRAGAYHLETYGDRAAEFGAKLTGTTVRLAAVCAVLWAAETGDSIDAAQWRPDTIAAGCRAAVALARYYAPATVAAYQSAGTPSAVSDAAKLWATVQALPLRWTRRELHRLVEHRYRTAAELAAVLEVLEERGYIRATDVQEPRGKGRPSLRFETNPAALHGEGGRQHAAHQAADGARWEEPAQPMTAAAQWAAELQQPAAPVAQRPDDAAAAGLDTAAAEQDTAEPGTAAEPAQRRPKSREIASGIPGVRVREVDYLGLGFGDEPTQPAAADDAAAEPAPDRPVWEWPAGAVKARILTVAADAAQWRLAVPGSETLQAYVPLPGVGTIRLRQAGGGYIVHGGSGSVWSNPLAMVPSIDAAAAAAAAAVKSGSIW